MKSVIFSINRPHTDNIKIGAKTSELRTRPPKIKEPYKAFIYETKKNGGCGKVIGEFTAFNEWTYRMCMGVPKHLVLSGCISVEDIWAYTNKGEKDLTEISISDLVIYDKPKELSEFKKAGFLTEENWLAALYPNTHCHYEAWAKKFDITKPPQSWCFVESEVTR